MRAGLPVGPFGISDIKTTVSGKKSVRKLPSLNAKDRSSSRLVMRPGFSTTAAPTTSWNSECGMAKQMSVLMEGCLSKTSSTANGESFSPLRLMISFGGFQGRCVWEGVGGWGGSRDDAQGRVKHRRYLRLDPTS